MYTIIKVKKDVKRVFFRMVMVLLKLKVDDTVEH